MTVAPSIAKTFAIEAPIPELLPVTRATLSFSCKSIFYSLARFRAALPLSCKREPFSFSESFRHELNRYIDRYLCARQITHIDAIPLFAWNVVNRLNQSRLRRNDRGE